ncbi:VOC family protein [Niabella sp.]|uniref:VOC family protein n=1 Tax=Niabella sp. TaxID=1962976 RepID=UPI0026273783|nr:VOC family protein [Niabella sp.]
MEEPLKTGQIQQVGTVFVPVANQDDALEFYTRKLGFEKRVEAVYAGGKRWIEVAPPNSVINIALVSDEEGTGTADDRTCCAFSTNDIEATFKMLKENGVDMVDKEIGRRGTGRLGLFAAQKVIEDPTPPQFSFRDPDGNRFLIVEVL